MIERHNPKSISSRRGQLTDKSTIATSVIKSHFLNFICNIPNENEH